MPVSRRTLEKEHKFAAMRVISEWVDQQRQQERNHTPPWGTIGIGGADFEFLLKATVGEAYLRVLRQGGSPFEAYTEAARDGSECVRTWNEKTHKTRAYVAGPYELKRWDKAGEAEADKVHVHYLILLGPR